MEYCPFEEKRAFVRFPVLIMSSCFSSGLSRAIDSRTHDISTKGLCIVTEEQLELGDCVDICLIMQDNGERIYAKGRVIWSNPISNSRLQYRVGVSIDEADYRPISLALRAIKVRRNY